MGEQKLGVSQRFQLLLGALAGLWFFFLGGGYWLFDNWLSALVWTIISAVALVLVVFSVALIAGSGSNWEERDCDERDCDNW